MGASQSTSQPITKIITTLPVLYSTSDDYTVIKKSKPKKQIDVAPYPTNVNSPKSKKKNHAIIRNRKKCTNYNK